MGKIRRASNIIDLSSGLPAKLSRKRGETPRVSFNLAGSGYEKRAKYGEFSPFDFRFLLGFQFRSISITSLFCVRNPRFGNVGRKVGVLGRARGGVRVGEVGIFSVSVFVWRNEKAVHQNT